MKTLVIIFIVIASVSSLGSMAYTITDIILETYRKKNLVVVPPEPVVVYVPQPEPEPEPEVVEMREHVDAEEADKLISDDLAMSGVKREPGGGTGYRAFINIGLISQNFEAEETVTLQALKDKKLIEKKAGRVKILADGELNKALTIKADSFSIQAIKMIELTGGTPIILE